jgi:hypothetical protein
MARTRSSPLIPLLIVILVVIAWFLWTRLGPQPPHSLQIRNAASDACDSSLWDHVYHSCRPHVLAPCVTVTGTVAFIRRESDEDDHIEITVDPGFEWTLNSENISRKGGYPVVESVCENSVTQRDAITSCSGFTPQLTIPSVGDHIRITGPFVLDTDHGWQELDPVTAFQPNVVAHLRYS